MTYQSKPVVPRSLPYNITRSIHRDLISLVLRSGQSKFDGAAFDFIYKELHGIVSHGFDEGSLYEIFCSKDYSRAFVLKVA